MYDLLLVLKLLGALDQLFHDTESLLVGSQILEIVQDGVKDIFPPLLAECLDDLLNHMLTLVVARELGDVIVLSQRLLDDLKLLLFSHRVDDGLKGPSSSIVAGYLHELLALDLS